VLNDFLKLQADMLVARAELGLALSGGWLLDKAAPSADGNRPVVMIPGFLASETTLSRLGQFLNRHGFAAHSWGMGRNLGPRGQSWNEVLDQMTHEVGATIRRLADTHSAPVALIGQSLGGVYARELAAHMPDEIDRVIMLGSPTLHPYILSHHNRVIAQMGYWVSRQSHAEMAGRRGLLHLDPDHPPLPCVSIHSPCDGVVDESSAVIPRYIVDQSDNSAPRENLRVLSSHVGMSVNPWVLLAVADRLVQDRDDWEPFNPYNYFPENLKAVVSRLYPAQEVDAVAADITTLAETGS
jgi:pimeloyl-ACP methyl ester carboxylesterase